MELELTAAIFPKINLTFCFYARKIPGSVSIIATKLRIILNYNILSM
jgi:hypothetical protein